jgi:UDP-glucose 4-epimerase
MASDVAGDAFNISGGRELTTRHLAETIIRLAGSSLTPEYRAAPTTGFRITTDGPFHYDNAKAKRVLGWSPEVSIEDGIARMIAWRRST